METNNGGKYSGFFSKKLKAGRRRTYFFDVRSTKQGDFFLTITESKKKFEGDGFESHKIFLYKEDFKKFLEALNETVDYIKSDLMPDYDYDTERVMRVGNNHVSGHPEQEVREILSESDKTESVVPPANIQISDDEEIDWK